MEESSQSILCLGEAPTELMAVQTGHDTVEISWTAPSVRPGDGYRIITDINNASADVPASPHTITVSTPGVYSIQVMSLSRHLPGRAVELQEVIVSGKHTTLLL